MQLNFKRGKCLSQATPSGKSRYITKKTDTNLSYVWPLSMTLDPN